ncbi:MAG: oxaloacetate decarboxylase [Bauldia sp.]|nr:MAG: oxaloacetate decarboxylase [Bauldia sp.]MBE0691956.1 oxaloacetate decarboxylase [Aquamicrobium sp.]
MTSSGRKLRELISRDDLAIVPGAGSPLELRLIEAAGFEAAYISGYATAANRFGLPDIGLIGFREVEDMIHAAVAVSTLPLIVDCDTGYGDVANVRRTVRSFEAAGAAALQIEDQSWPKRCGHMEGKRIEPLDVAVRKIRAAVESRRDDDTVIIARTDALGPLGIDEALNRCLLYKEAGADVLFVDGPESEEHLVRIGGELPGPVMVNMSESGKTPILPAARLRELGFAFVIYPSSSLRVEINAVSDFYRTLKRDGISTVWADRMTSLDETNQLLGIDEFNLFADRMQSAAKSGL